MYTDHLACQIRSEQLTITIDKCITQYDHYLLMGDLNYDLLCKNKGETLFDLMELFDLCNLIKEPTCFMKNCKNSLLDVPSCYRFSCYYRFSDIAINSVNPPFI